MLSEGPFSDIFLPSLRSLGPNSVYWEAKVLHCSCLLTGKHSRGKVRFLKQFHPQCLVPCLQQQCIPGNPSHLCQGLLWLSKPRARVDLPSSSEMCEKSISQRACSGAPTGRLCGLGAEQGCGDTSAHQQLLLGSGSLLFL